MDIWLAVLVRTFQSARTLFMIAPLYVLVEVLLPKQQVSWRSRAQSAVFTLTEFPITALLAIIFYLLWSQLHVAPLISIRLDHWLGTGWLAASAAAVLATIIGDFCFYWMHRAQHRFFWRFHSVHHSIEELSALSCYHHPTEELFRIFLIAIPFSFIWHVDPGPAAPLLVATLINHHTYWVHSSSKLHWGPLRRIFDDNRFHRIHHSRDPAHFNKNFGGFTTVWDQLFGTAYFPAKDEWPEVGLSDRPEARTVVGYFMAPFKKAST